MRWRLAIVCAVSLYCLAGAWLIAQKPGLQYDEALLVAGAVHLRHSPGEFALQHAPHSWTCALGRCLPLMAEGRYIGPMKEYLAVPLFAAFGPRPSVTRGISLLLGAVGLWAMARAALAVAGGPVAAALAFALAIHPAFVNMTVFDNGAVAAMMAGFGLLCWSLAAYARRESAAAAFWVGVAAGFGVWARANFVWTLAAAAGATAIVLGRRVMRPKSHWAALIAGGCLGGFPFLVYEALSRGGTWQATQLLADAEPLRTRLISRMAMLSEALLVDGEHRAMWDSGNALAEGHRWMPVLVVAVACGICLRWQLGRWVTLTFLFLGAILMLTGVQIAEHHLIALVPLAVGIVVLACSRCGGSRTARMAMTALALTYVVSAAGWEIAGIRGLQRTGGLGVWSDAVTELATRLERQYPQREIKILDWGLQNNLYVISDGRIRTKEMFWRATAQVSGLGRAWIDEIRDGGVFLAAGKENREELAASPDFLRELARARPVLRKQTVATRTGSTYAQIIEIDPDSTGAGGAAPEPPLVEYVNGFYPLEGSGWRWTRKPAL